MHQRMFIPQDVLVHVAIDYQKSLLTHGTLVMQWRHSESFPQHTDNSYIFICIFLNCAMELTEKERLLVV